MSDTGVSRRTVIVEAAADIERQLDQLLATVQDSGALVELRELLLELRDATGDVLRSRYPRRTAEALFWHLDHLEVKVMHAAIIARMRGGSGGVSTPA